jgi:hypothetical protein
MVIESWARSMGATARLMPANAITDAKTNFFIQCSWELPKWKSMLLRSLPQFSTAFRRG